MKKHRLGLTCILATLIIMTAFFNPAHAAASFKDMERFKWATTAVDYLVEKSVVNGVGDDQFGPHKELTRGEAAKIIALILQLDVNMKDKTNFIDAKDHWASPYIKAIQTNKPGVLNGYTDGTFKPNKLVTREELTKMIVLSYGYVKNPDYSVHFDDVSGWSADYIEILASHFVIYGKSEGVFAPANHVNRAEAAVMIYRANEVFPSNANPEFQFKRTIEKDGIEFEVMFGQLYGKLYVKTKATNASEDSIPYIASDGCDQGLSTALYSEIGNGEVKAGNEWRNPLIACTQAIKHLVLEPGDTIEEMAVLNPPIEGIKENHYVKVYFKRGIREETSTATPIEIDIPLEGLE